MKILIDIYNEANLFDTVIREILIYFNQILQYSFSTTLSHYYSTASTPS